MTHSIHPGNGLLLQKLFDTLARIESAKPTHLHSSMRQEWLIMYAHSVYMYRTAFDPFGNSKAFCKIPW